MKYYPNRLSEVIDIKDIYTIHYFKYGRNFTGPGEAHPFWEMVYIDSGVAEIIAGKKRFFLPQGEAVFHKPNEFHNILTHKNYANSVIVSFQGNGKALSKLKNLVSKLTQEEKELLNQIVLEGTHNYSDPLNEIFLAKMTKRPSSPFGADQMIKNTLEMLLISIIRRQEDVQGQQTEKKIEVVEKSGLTAKIIQVLTDSLYTTLTLDEISKRVFFSPAACKKTFKKETGTTIMNYYNRLKIEQAKKLLAENELTATEIANTLDFGSLQYFSRVFTKYVEMSPTEYQKSTKLDNLI